MKKDLIELIDSQKEIEKMFHSFDGGMGTSFERISDVPEFQSWIQEIKLELQEIYDRTHDTFVWETVNLCGKRLDGFTEKKYFIELVGKLQAIRKHIDKYYPEEKEVLELSQLQGGAFEMKKKPLIFISHSSKNKDQVAKIAELLRSINLSPRRDIFCSSLPGYGIPNGANIFDFLRKRFRNYDLHIIFVHSPEYYESAVSLNEMGLYVDHLIETNDKKEKELSDMKELVIENTEKMEQVLKQAAKVLANNTNYATLVSAPDVNHNKVKFIQLSQVDDQHLLAVIVMNNNMVRNKMLDLYEPLDNETILKLNILLNTSLNGLAMNEINLGNIASIKERAGIHSGIVSDVIDALAQTFAESEDLKIYTSGATNILKYPELSVPIMQRHFCQHLRKRKS